jgi:hypothetical protein
MNVRDLMDTVEAKVVLLADLRKEVDRAAIRRQIEDHLDEMRTALGLPYDEPCCCGCGCDPLRRCPDCGGHYCERCGDSEDGVFLCEVCRDEREDADQAGDARQVGSECDREGQLAGAAA